MSAPSSGQPKVWSLWIFDRHCTLIYHADWSSFHSRGLQASSSTAPDGLAKTGAGRGGGGASSLPLAEQAKLVYGLVFSLRNMTKKLSPHNENNDGNDQAASRAPSTTAAAETLHGFSTSTYTLAHLQTPTKYTFVMFTDPVAPPTRRAPTTSGSTASATFSGGGGIPATGGMTTTGVLMQIARGPWVEFVARNPACFSLERAESDDDDDDDGAAEDAKASQDGPNDVRSRQEQRRKAKQDALTKQRLSGIGKSVDSEAFRAAVERVLAQNKLNAPRM